MLVQLAGQIRATVAMDADPFAKVKGLIEGMISKLLVEAQEEASHKEFCDRETKENEAKRGKLQAENSKLATRIERAQAGIAGLKQQIAELNKALQEIAKSQKEMDAMRQSEHAEFVKAEADFKQGVAGVRNALKILRNYYQSNGAALVQEPTTSVHSASSDSGNGIISILEVAESDFARSLAEAQAGEDDAVEVYTNTTNENKVSTATKRTTVEGKTQEVDRLSQLISDASSDKAGVEDELSAVLEYLDKLRPQCTTEPMSYEERKARRESEIEGLKSALNILENETALVQQGKSFLAARN
jgi:myosin heavy subunit